MGKVSTSYKPGQSGNPSGRPKSEWTWAGLLRKVAEEVDPARKKEFKRLVADSLFKRAISGDVNAIKEFGNRIDGMPQQKHEIGGDIKISFHESLKQVDE